MLSPKLEFTIEKEENQKINFLDITITRESGGFSIDIQRKPTYTDIIIPKDLCHPNEQKMAAIRYFYDRLHKYEPSSENREKESKTLQQILVHNGYDDSTLRNLSNKKTANLENKSNRKQWVKFTYIGKETRAITKAFRNTSVNISLSTNTLSNLITIRCHSNKNKYDNSSVYQLTCPTCHKKYTGQTGRSFNTRFQEHFRDFKYRNNKSTFAQHLLENRHAIGSMEDMMETVYITKRSHLMDTGKILHFSGNEA